MFIAEYIGLYFITMFLGRSSGAPLNYLVAMAAPFVVFGLERIRLIMLTVAAGLGTAYLLVVCLHAPQCVDPRQATTVLDPLYIQTAITVGILISGLCLVRVLAGRTGEGRDRYAAA